MNQQVWKHAIAIQLAGFGITMEAEMPVGAQIVHVREQGNDAIAIWFLVDAEQAVLETRSFNIYGTGHGPILFNERYVGTAIFAGGSLVLHVFEVARMQQAQQVETPLEAVANA